MTRWLQCRGRSSTKRMIAFCMAALALAGAIAVTEARAQTSEIRPEDELVVPPRPMTALELRLRALHPDYYDPKRPEFASRPPDSFWLEQMAAIEQSDPKTDALADLERDVVGLLVEGTPGWRIRRAPGVDCTDQAELRKLAVFTFWIGSGQSKSRWRASYAFEEYATAYNGVILSRSLQPLECEGR